MKSIYFILSLVFSILLVNAQEPVKKSKKELKAEKAELQKDAVKKLVESKSFVFDARTVFSATAGNVTISYPYNVKLDKDSIHSFLPYYGRAYTVEYGTNDSPMVFNLPLQEMEIIKEKRKGYRVNVKVKKGMDNILFSFSISETGSTTLTVNSTNRQVITYYGDIVAKEETDDSL
jgi:hypothetical protein